jgi:hypothetical protein
LLLNPADGTRFIGTESCEFGCLVKRGQLAASRLGIIPGMKSDARRVLKVTKAKPSKEYANLLRQLWKEGHERVTASILETRKVEKERGKSPL